MYDDHYGLTGRPFQLTPDPRFWFDTATHKKAMAYLGYGLAQGEGFIIVTGDIGAGKTTLIGHLVDTIDGDRLNVIRIVSTQIAADDLLRTVCAGLDIDAGGLSKAGMLSGIERGLHAVARGGRRTLLIVDEAQALPVDSLEELRMLSNFQAAGHALLQIVLLGQPEFRDKLANATLEQLRQRVIAMHHLGPMEADELAPYLIHRLGVVGWAGRPDFDADALGAIYAWSGGIPRRVNQLVSRMLLHGAIEGIDAFTAADVAAVIDDLQNDGMSRDIAAGNEIEPDEAPPSTDAAVMEWPFKTDDAVPTDAWRPIALEEVAADETRPIIVESPNVDVDASIDRQAEPTEADEHFEAIAAPPRLFGRFKLSGRKPMLAPVDPAPADEVEPVAAATPAPVVDLDIARRLAEIDKRLEDQDEALRRVLTLLVDWVEGGTRIDPAGLRDRAG